jgi:uncharacterized protein (DUF1697 family)
LERPDAAAGGVVRAAHGQRGLKANAVVAIAFFHPATSAALKEAILMAPGKGWGRGMALVVFLRGINVGGHRTFRPTLLARALGDYDVVNVGAAGTFVVRKPASRAKFRAALLRQLPFEAKVVLCDGRDLIRLERENPFGARSSPPDQVRFVSILSKSARLRPGVPITLPPGRDWLLRVIGSKNRFVFGVYRRHMKTIGYLGQIDKLFGVLATTRNWNTIVAIARMLRSQGKKTGQMPRAPGQGKSRTAGALPATGYPPDPSPGLAPVGRMGRDSRGRVSAQ